MTFSKVQDSNQSFSKTIEDQISNSIDIEQSSIPYEYTNKDVAHYENSEMKINLYENILLGKYFPVIKNSCTLKTISREDQFRYNYRPELLSTDTYGTPSLWYIIMRCNNCEDINDFKDLPTVYLPDIVIIENCISNEEFIKAKTVL